MMCLESELGCPDQSSLSLFEEYTNFSSVDVNSSSKEHMPPFPKPSSDTQGHNDEKLGSQPP